MEWLSKAIHSAGAEFADVADPALVGKAVARLLVAACLGALLGWERESIGKSAGIRTHMLAALGAAAFVMVPQLMGASEADVSRVIQGLVAGVGFLCAGAILKSEESGQAKGLTTAAGLWLTAAVGMAAGMGRESLAILTAALALGVLAIGPRLAWGKAEGPPGKNGPEGGRPGARGVADGAPTGGGGER